MELKQFAERLMLVMAAWVFAHRSTAARSRSAAQRFRRRAGNSMGTSALQGVNQACSLAIGLVVVRACAIGANTQPPAGFAEGP